MKRIDLKKLQLKTTTIRVLDNTELPQVAGGAARTIWADCSMSCSNPTASVCVCTNKTRCCDYDQGD